MIQLKNKSAFYLSNVNLQIVNETIAKITDKNVKTVADFIVFLCKQQNTPPTENTNNNSEFEQKYKLLLSENEDLQSEIMSLKKLLNESNSVDDVTQQKIKDLQIENNILKRKLNDFLFNKNKTETVEVSTENKSIYPILNCAK